VVFAVVEQRAERELRNGITRGRARSHPRQRTLASSSVSPVMTDVHVRIQTIADAASSRITAPSAQARAPRRSVRAASERAHCAHHTQGIPACC
jgi:hypothetical protein